MNGATEYKKYPMHMHHPSEQPAIISDDYDQGMPRLGYNANPGRARMFPPVTVNSEEQEEYHKSRGYVGGKSDKVAALRTPTPTGYHYAEYPQMVDGRVVADPDAPPPVTNEYPKWIATPGGEVLVQSAEQEEVVLRGTSKGEPVKREDPAIVYPGNCGEDAGAECGLRDPAKCAVHGPIVVGNAELQTRIDEGDEPWLRREIVSAGRQRSKARWQAIRRAKSLGIPADRTWDLARAVKAIDEAERAAEQEAIAASQREAAD